MNRNISAISAGPAEKWWLDPTTKSRGDLQLPRSGAGAGAGPGRASARLGGVPIPRHAGEAFLGGRACGAVVGWSQPPGPAPPYISRARRAAPAQGP